MRKSWRRSRLLIIFILCTLFSTLLTAASAHQSRPRRAQEADWRVAVEPERVVNGSPCSIKVTSSEPLKSLRGRLLERTVFFDFDPQSGTWHGLAGVAVETAPGNYEIEFEGVTTAGARLSHRARVTVAAANYPDVRLRVARRFTQPNAATLQRIKREQALKREIFSRVTPRRLWSGPFAPPLKSLITDIFGTSRSFNGVVQSVHQGVDYRAAMGTPIAAMNAGRVILAQGLYFEGNCVVIDHGQGLLTLYLHLSRLKVSEGEVVTRGQIIGLSGATGRVTAPHLHAAARWQGIYLDPETLIKLALPEMKE